ncbi:unnamed protein product [Caenorhabditis sp. 36 PRJEB53466]|nr:unnamed protein product [Caenorhabditis sp. 36 PRJEB53466]
MAQEQFNDHLDVVLAAGFLLVVVDKTEKKLQLDVAGPANTSCFQRHFVVDIQFPDFIKDTLVTKIWHPLIDPNTGDIKFTGQCVIFQKTAQFWSGQFAGGLEPMEEDLVKILGGVMLMGFDMEKEIIALSMAQWNFDRAIDSRTIEEGPRPDPTSSVFPRVPFPHLYPI